MIITINNTSAFWVMVQKEITDTVRSWKFLIMGLILLLTCSASLYSALSDFSTVVKLSKSNDFFFLRIFTHSSDALPSFIVFVSFIGPLLGISMGFEAINSEQSKGTLSRILAQPVYRDYILNAKFTASLIVLSALFIFITLVVVGFGLLLIGIPPTFDEVLRLFVFSLINIIYVGFWLNLSIFFSVKFKQSATSALSGLALWIFFTIFFGIIINVLAQSMAPSIYASENTIVAYQSFIQNVNRINPVQLFNEAVNTVLMPTVRTLGPLSRAEKIGTLPSILPLQESIFLIWPHITALISACISLFGFSYYYFMRKEIRSR
ncbi:ABC transporter permease [Flammeovirga yaeyamensis]|uniref:ABC transporter permease n=1 Tax=Flammeovirga yaeyamensis TaxID=367791 RepID=A0AAX1N4Y7_9BACT|nr:ABC transporter permease subunit [Flammeovirga yaeyamensis]MBB3701305.1 ABC-2 type transport system permease protein [Flammeovirga yaeyamensis]NMF38226.1 ABC transporter permease subunit [Flammeovirga yaeyamensis]QWG02638.1 ABC transporter permease [Flammeovirga yaeyamensis]